jgi:hypothetical protein
MVMVDNPSLLQVEWRLTDEEIAPDMTTHS